MTHFRRAVIKRVSMIGYDGSTPTLFKDEFGECPVVALLVMPDEIVVPVSCRMSQIASLAGCFASRPGEPAFFVACEN